MAHSAGKEGTGTATASGSGMHHDHGRASRNDLKMLHNSIQLTSTRPAPPRCAAIADATLSTHISTRTFLIVSPRSQCRIKAQRRTPYFTLITVADNLGTNLVCLWCGFTGGDSWGHTNNYGMFGGHCYTQSWGFPSCDSHWHGGASSTVISQPEAASASGQATGTGSMSTNAGMSLARRVTLRVAGLTRTLFKFDSESAESKRLLELERRRPSLLSTSKLET
jgi:hypothetical protein